MIVKPKKVLILGSGGLKVGQAGEFDYSGSQAIKALREENIRTVLVNPNIATVQTDPDMADEVYLQPLNIATVTRIIEKEKPDSILLSVGGQTALNLGLALEEAGVFKKYGLQVLGTSISSIRITEDRELFKQALAQIDIKTANSFTVNSILAAVEAAKKLGFPVMLRTGFSLGGLDSGVIGSAKEMYIKAKEALHQSSQLLIEECLSGWKEVEYEIVRDCEDSTIAICNMENLDPVGIHTGDSIVIAPSQTLTNAEYHHLREIAIKCAKTLGIIGECNIQYALNQKNGDYRVIEVNARLSRSSALASKATGYPIAFVSTKLSIGLRLDEITNNATKKTTAFFEPALDYIVLKMPRWDTQKLKNADRRIGTEMKSVGEVMAIGRSFPEVLQKAIRMLNIGASGLTDYPGVIHHIKNEIEKATDRRIFALYQWFLEGGSIEEACAMSSIDPWFLHHLKEIAKFQNEIASGKASLLGAKKMGFSDRAISKLTHESEDRVRQQRISLGIMPSIKQIDTLAGEFSAETNYLYCTYNASFNDVAASLSEPILVLGSGPYCIGSSVEFDWCAVNTVKTLKKLSESTVIINSNPETVSTDYDESDRLYFEEITFERVSDIADFESPRGIIVSVGGQIANNLSLPLHLADYPILGTHPESIENAENRRLFSALLDKLLIDQPAWDEVTTLTRAKAFAKKVGYPVIVRPSYVLSGSSMNTVASEKELEQVLEQAAFVSQDNPVVISQFINHAKEIEIDGVAQNGEIVIEAISEHIENAGIHSGDATIVLPPQTLSLETIHQCKKITQAIISSLNMTGPFNIQFIAIDNAIKVIECNARASRSFPFVSKVTNHNFIRIATEVLLDRYQHIPYEALELDYVGVKTAQFSYSRFKGANPVAHVEMASTGEVVCLGDHLLEAFYMSWFAAEQSVHGKRLLLSIGKDNNSQLFISMLQLEELGWEFYATEQTQDQLYKNGIRSHLVYTGSKLKGPNVLTLIEEKQVDLIINIPSKTNGRNGDIDGFNIRRLAIDHHIPLITNFHVAELFLHCLTKVDASKIPIKSLREYTAPHSQSQFDLTGLPQCKDARYGSSNINEHSAYH